MGPNVKEKEKKRGDVKHLPSVGVAGFEPATSWSQTRRDNRATLHPDTFGNASNLYLVFFRLSILLRGRFLDCECKVKHFVWFLQAFYNLFSVFFCFNVQRFDSMKLPKKSAFEKLLRRERDSNPRYSYPYVSLANWWFKPLTHPSYNVQ